MFFESIKAINGNICHLDYHSKRVNKTRKEVLGLDTPLNLSCINGLFPNTGIYRLFLAYSKDIETFTYREYITEYIKTLKIVHAELDYAYKYLNRNNLDKLYKQRKKADDILIIVNGLATDTTIANIICWDGTKWYTPDKPLLPGTTRQRLIDQKKIIPKKITEEQLFDYKQIVIINALRGIQRVKIISSE